MQIVLYYYMFVFMLLMKDPLTRDIILCTCRSGSHRLFTHTFYFITHSLTRITKSSIHYVVKKSRRLPHNNNNSATSDGDWEIID